MILRVFIKVFIRNTVIIRVGTRIPVPVPNFWYWDCDRCFKILGFRLELNSENVGIGIQFENFWD